MKIPKEIKISGSTWKIKREKNPQLDGLVVSAVTYPVTRTIVICTSLTGEELVHTFFHEFNHAVMAELGMHNCNIVNEVEEIIVDNFARIYLQTFNMGLKCRTKKR